MSQLSLTYSSFSPSSTISSNKFNTNYTDITTWANGNIQQDNFGTMSGKVTWSQSTAYPSIGITHTGAGDSDRAAIAVSSTTVGVLFSRMTTTQRNAISSPPEGLELYNTSNKRKEVYDGVAWQGTAKQVVASKTTTYTALLSDDIILCDTSGGAWELALPTAASGIGKQYVVKKTTADFNALTINPNSAETVDGSSTTTLNTLGETVTIVSDGSNWQLVDRRIPSTWTSFTPTGTWATNTTYAGMWRRVGDNVEVDYRVILSGAPTGNFTLNLPSGLSIDTAKLADSVNSEAALNITDLIIHDTSPAARYLGRVVYLSATSLSGGYYDDASGGVSVAAAVSATAPITFASGDDITVRISVPVVGWNG